MQRNGAKLFAVGTGASLVSEKLACFEMLHYLLNLAVRLFCAIIGAFPEHIYLFCQDYLYFWSIFPYLSQLDTPKFLV